MNDLASKEKQEFQQHWAQLSEINPDWRIGQSMFNALYHIRPDLADRLRGGELDPFYRTHTNHSDVESIGKTMEWLEQHWEDPSS